MFDQLVIENKLSLDDFGASLKTRSIKAPRKKSIKQSVPFSNITYDFSAINGEVYWEERELEYIFEMIAPTPEKLEEMKTAFANWVMNVAEQKIYDPYIPDYHYLGTFDDINFADEESMDKSTITVVFLAYPYKIANIAKKYSMKIEAGGEKTVAVVNDSSHRITPAISSDAAVTMRLNNVVYSIGAGVVKDDDFKLLAGKNTVIIQNTAQTECNLIISFNEEVF